jgi:hypothetical protein
MTTEFPKLLLFHKKRCNRNALVRLIKPGTSAQDCTSEKLFEICDGRVSPSLRHFVFNFFPNLLARKTSWIILKAGSTHGGSTQ